MPRRNGNAVPDQHPKKKYRPRSAGGPQRQDACYTTAQRDHRDAVYEQFLLARTREYTGCGGGRHVIRTEAHGD